MDYSLLTEQKISEKYESLPQDLRNILSSVNTATTIESITTKYRLDEEKTTMLIQLVGLVILGFASFEDMKEEMKETIEISHQFIPLIADEIQQKIFKSVINSLKKPVATPITPPIMPTPTTPAPAPVPTKPTDRYRESVKSAPEVVDLRKAPPISTPMQPSPTKPAPSLPPKPIIVPMPVAPKPTPPAPIPPPPPAPAPAPTPLPPPAPKPIQVVPFIEANPHKIPEIKEIPPADTYREPVRKPQYIIRPMGEPPTDSPRDILDLKKDRGEF